MSAIEKRYSKIEREALGILHTLRKLHHHCFAREVSIITHYKPLVAVFKKGVATLSQRLQYVQYRVRIIYKCGPDLFIADWLSRQNPKENKDDEMLGLKINIFKKGVATLSQRLQYVQYRVRIIYKCGPDLFIADWLSRQNPKENKDDEMLGLKINIFKKGVATLSQRLQYVQYRVRIIYKCGPDLFIADWLSRQNPKENKDDEMLGLKININAIHTIPGISKCMTIQKLQQVMTKDDNLQQLREHIICSWPQSRNKVPQEITPYLMFRDGITVIGDIIL